MKKYTRIIETFDRMAEVYGGPEGLEEVNRVRLATLAGRFEGLVLDVGCGSGTFIEKYLDPERNFVVSADFSENMIRVARDRLAGRFSGGFAFAHCLAQQLPFPDETFDACVCINTLHNMPQWNDVAASVAEMARVLKTGGRLLIEFRNMNNPNRRRITQLYDWPHLPQKAFTFVQMKKLLDNAGAEIAERIPIYGEVVTARQRASSPPTGVFSRRAPRIGILAVKSRPFSEFLKD